MKNFKNINILALLVLVIVGAVFLAINSQIIVAIILPILAIATLFIPQSNSSQEDNNPLLNKIAKTLHDIKSGKLASRVVLYKNETQLEHIAWDINNSLDQMEVILRESRNTIEAISDGQMYRSMFPSGLHGEFKDTANAIQKAVASMKAQYHYNKRDTKTTK